MAQSGQIRVEVDAKQNGPKSPEPQTPTSPSFRGSVRLLPMTGRSDHLPSAPPPTRKSHGTVYKIFFCLAILSVFRNFTGAYLLTRSVNLETGPFKPDDVDSGWFQALNIFLGLLALAAPLIQTADSMDGVVDALGKLKKERKEVRELKQTIERGEEGGEEEEGEEVGESAELQQLKMQFTEKEEQYRKHRIQAIASTIVGLAATGGLTIMGWKNIQDTLTKGWLIPPRISTWLEYFFACCIFAGQSPLYVIKSYSLIEKISREAKLIYKDFKDGNYRSLAVKLSALSIHVGGAGIGVYANYVAGMKFVEGVTTFFAADRIEPLEITNGCFFSSAPFAMYYVDLMHPTEFIVNFRKLESTKWKVAAIVLPIGSAIPNFVNTVFAGKLDKQFITYGLIAAGYGFATRFTSIVSKATREEKAAAAERKIAGVQNIDEASLTALDQPLLGSGSGGATRSRYWCCFLPSPPVRKFSEDEDPSELYNGDFSLA